MWALYLYRFLFFFSLCLKDVFSCEGIFMFFLSLYTRPFSCIFFSAADKDFSAFFCPFVLRLFHSFDPSSFLFPFLGHFRPL